MKRKIKAPDALALGIKLDRGKRAEHVKFYKRLDGCNYDGDSLRPD